uniref:Uncharacterized protein n=1 Tax=Arundo donax TaxID=35708 RepID=A0A0A8XP13_ARUDO
MRIFLPSGHATSEPCKLIRRSFLPLLLYLCVAICHNLFSIQFNSLMQCQGRHMYSFFFSLTVHFYF